MTGFFEISVLNSDFLIESCLFSTSEINYLMHLLDAGNGRAAAKLASIQTNKNIEYSYLKKGHFLNDYGCTIQYCSEMTKRYGPRKTVFDIGIDCAEKGYTIGSSFFYPYQSAMEFNNAYIKYLLESVEESLGKFIMLSGAYALYFNDFNNALKYILKAKEIVTPDNDLNIQIDYACNFFKKASTEELKKGQLGTFMRQYFKKRFGSKLSNFIKYNYNEKRNYLMKSRGLILPALFSTPDKKENEYKRLFFEEKVPSAGFMLYTAYTDGAYWLENGPDKSKAAEILEELLLTDFPL